MDAEELVARVVRKPEVPAPVHALPAESTTVEVQFAPVKSAIPKVEPKPEKKPSAQPTLF
jgi:hypothetical protein